MTNRIAGCRGCRKGRKPEVSRHSLEGLPTTLPRMNRSLYRRPEEERSTYPLTEEERSQRPATTMVVGSSTPKPPRFSTTWKKLTSTTCRFVPVVATAMCNRSTMFGTVRTAIQRRRNDANALHACFRKLNASNVKTVSQIDTSRTCTRNRDSFITTRTQSHQRPLRLPVENLTYTNSLYNSHNINKGIEVASIINRPNGHRWIQFVDQIEKRRTIRLGKTTKKHAQEVCSKVEALLAAKTAGNSIDQQTAEWLVRCQGKVRQRLVVLGLAEPARQSRTLEEWLKEFRERNKSWKKSSIENYNATRDCLLEYFDGNRRLDSFTRLDAEDFRDWMATEKSNRQTGKPGLADDTVRRRCGRSKTIFRHAIKRGFAVTNPFQEIVSCTRGNPKRQFFVESSVIYDCIEQAPCIDWETIIALCRFGGLRCPTEVIGLMWNDVNLPAGEMVIRAPKTEHTATGGVRVCPIFPELRPYLEEAWDVADDGATRVISRYSNPKQNLRTQFERIITRAGHQPWPRLFQNLRATRETELMARFPAKDVATWLGNSEPVAMMHYAMATKASFESTKTTASSFGSNAKLGEAKSEARNDDSDENTKQNAKQHRTE